MRLYWAGGKPFDAVQGWFEGLWNSVWDAANSASRWLWDQIRPAFDSIVQLINSSFSWLWDQIQSGLSWVLDQIGSSLTTLWTNIQAGFGNLQTWMGEQWSSFSASFGESINSLWNGMQSGFSTLWTNIEGGLGGLWDSLTGLASDILSGVTGALGSGLQSFLDWLLKSLTWMGEMIVGAVNNVAAAVQGGFNQIVSGAIDWVTGALTPGSPDKRVEQAVGSMVATVWNAQMNMLKRMYRSPPKIEESWDTAQQMLIALIGASISAMIAGCALDLAHPFKNLNIHVTLREAVYWAGIPAVTAAIATTPTAIGLLEPLRYYLNETFQPSIPTPEQLIRLRVRGLIGGEEYLTNMARQGFNNDWANLLLNAYWDVPSVSDLAEMFRRGIIDIAKFVDTMRYMGVREDFIDPYFMLTERLLTPEQLIRLAVRRIIDLSKFTSEMLKHGITAENSSLILSAYWDMPSISALMEMLWRGLIDEGGFKSALRYMGVREDFIDPYFELTKRVPGPSDLIRFQLREVFRPERRPQLLAEYPSDEYFKWMAAQGYSKYWAENYWAAHWELPSITQLNEMLIRRVIDRETWHRYVVYNDYIPEAIPWLEKIIYSPYTRVDARRMWALGVISDEELYENYRDLGYDDEHAKKMTLWTKVYERLPDLERLYRNGWINADEFKAELANLGLSAEQVDWIFKTVVPKSKLERTKKERDLTKTDILRLHRIGEISDTDALEMLIELGYDEDEAEYLIALNKASLESEIRDLSTSQILKAYRYEIMSREEAKAKLIDIGWKEEAAETLLKLEDIKLQDAKTERMRERDLSRTDIIKAVQRGIIDVQTGYNYLAYLGYSDWEIRVIFALEEIPWPTGS